MLKTSRCIKLRVPTAWKHATSFRSQGLVEHYLLDSWSGCWQGLCCIQSHGTAPRNGLLPPSRTGLAPATALHYAPRTKLSDFHCCLKH
eukprot:202072-Amphidinium_carterae.1